MALIDSLKNIANAIREKNGTETQYKPSEMADAVRNIPGGGGGADFTELERVFSNGFTDYSYYFYYRKTMTEAPSEILKHTASGTSFANMFYECNNLAAIPQIDTSSGTAFNAMCLKCSSITTVPQFNLSKGTNFNSMFNSCTNLTETPSLDTSKGTGFSQVFTQCKNLVTIGGIDFSSAGTSTSCMNAFNNCTALENITINGIIKQTGLDLSPCAKLTHTSLMSAINALYDWKANGGTSTYKLTLGSTNLVKLTDAEKAIATQKGWTLA